MVRIGLGIASLAAALVLDVAVLDRPFLLEVAPRTEALELLKTLCVAVGAWLLLAPFAHRERVAGIPLVPDGWPWRLKGHPLSRLAVISALAMPVGACLIFLLSPRVFTGLSREDRPVEMLSALAWLAASALVLLAWRRDPPLPSLGKLFVLGYAFLCFIIGMEEISWGQRIFRVETPEAFQDNIQNEINLHNFATDPFENVFYFGSFAFFVLLPFLRGSVQRPLHPALERLIPRRWVLWSSALFTAYNYDMWNILFTQLAFFFTLFILVHDVRSRPSRDRVLLLLGLVGIQLVFLLLGHRFGRLWDVTEYKELFIPWSALLYAADVLARSTRSSAATARAG